VFEGIEILRMGYTRFSLLYLHNEVDVNYIMDAIEFVS
jgi:hypothetical protein